MGISFLYTTDLHGDLQKYETILQSAIENKINLVHLGADLLPKPNHGERLLDVQKDFVAGYLRGYYKRCTEAGINLLAFFGNDDLYIFKKSFKEYGDLLDEKPYTQDSHIFTAYGYVPDYPFALKTACKLDFRGWKLSEPYLGEPVDVNEEDGIYDIEDIDSYFSKKSTIEEDLESLKSGPDSIV